MHETMYVSHAIARHGRQGHVEANDGALKFDLAMPGSPQARPGKSNPEQLFACAYAACFSGALEAAARKKKIEIGDAEVHTDVELNKDADGFFLGVTHNIVLPGMTEDAAEDLVLAAHAACPYSRATHGNIQVTLKVNDQRLSAAA